MADELHPEIIPASRLREEEGREMLALLRLYFDGVDAGTFRRDLAAKDWALLLRDARGAIMGFTTVQFLTVKCGGETITAAFSGDTVKHLDYYGSDHFAPLWLHFMLEEQRRLGGPLYWFLICSGFRTYKFLPAFFHRHYPSVDHPGDARGREILEALARAKFGDDFDSRTGLIRFSHSRERLRPGVGPVTDDMLRNPHVRFFLERNPRHHEGEELACLAEISPANLRPFGLRLARSWAGRRQGAPDLHAAPGPRSA